MCVPGFRGQMRGNISELRGRRGEKRKGRRGESLGSGAGEQSIVGPQGVCSHGLQGPGWRAERRGQDGTRSGQEWFGWGIQSMYSVMGLVGA